MFNQQLIIGRYIKKKVIELTIISVSDSKVYDSTPLIANDVEIYKNGQLCSQTEKNNILNNVLSIDITGSQILVGSCENTFGYEFKPGNNSSDYIITREFGTLTVTDGLGDDEDPVEDINVVEMYSGGYDYDDGYDDSSYALGYDVTFEIEVTNIYAESKTITLSEIEGGTLAQSVFENVAGGETRTTTATYRITQADILQGSFTNTVTATIGDLEKTIEWTITTEEPNPSLYIEIEEASTPSNGNYYTAQEPIYYNFKITNNGNLTIGDIHLICDLIGEDWYINELKVGETETFDEYYYIVTLADVEAGSIVCVATATGDSPDEDTDVNVEPGELEIMLE